MKGFIKILEVVIASVIILSVSSFFLVSKDSSADQWYKINAEISLKDSLAVLHRSGMLDKYISDDNPEIFFENFSAMMPESVEYSVDIEGIPSNVVRVGCIRKCGELKSLLDPLTFRFKGRKMRIAVQAITMNDIPPETDVLFIYDYSDLSSYQQTIENFISSGGYAFLLGDVTQENINNDPALRDVFGLLWVDRTPSQVNKFSDITDVSKLSYKIADYFSNAYARFYNNGILTISQNSYTVIICEDATEKYLKFNRPCNPSSPGETKIRSGDTFMLEGYTLKAYEIGWDFLKEAYYADIGIADKRYNFKGLASSQIAEDGNTIVSNTAMLSAVKAGSKGAVWFSGYAMARTDISQLLRAVIFWSSGEKYNFDMSEIRVPEKYITMRYIMTSNNRPFEAYSINLKYWWLFV